MNDLRSMYPEEILDEFNKLNFPSFRANQVCNWLSKGVDKFEDMKNLPKNMIDEISNYFSISSAIIEKKFVSKNDGTVKYLFVFADGACAESVVMSYHHGYSICISTQSGCRMGCKFCATGLDGFSRNLTAGEIISQIYTASKDMNIRISNVVLMGMGEPLDNFENVTRFIKLITNEKLLNIGSRHITVSTCGIAEKILPLAKINNQITLSISLHAWNDETRSEIMPINKKYNLSVLLNACREYIKYTNKRITFEYTLINGVNDTENDAEQLSSLLKGVLCHVNLIPVNPVKKSNFSTVKSDRIIKFSNILQKNGINATVRRTLGEDINASCGQLRRETNGGINL